MPSSSADRLKYLDKPMDQAFVMHQTWESLLFLHWEIDAAWVQGRLPPGLFVDTHQGKAYVGIVPFFMSGVRPRFCPSVPGVSRFMELNVRTYVTTEDGTPGVWFYSLDCNQFLAVWAARTFFHLPYFNAVMSATRGGPEIDYKCQRVKFPGTSRYRWQPGEELFEPEKESLECFLLNRCLLFSANSRNQLFSGRVWHHPYCWGNVKMLNLDQLPLIENGLPVVESPPLHACVSNDLQVEIYPLKKLV